MIQESIGKFIAQERKNAGMTQEQFAEKLGVSNRSVSRWENGKTMPDFSLFPLICQILKISTTELLNGKRIEKIDMNHTICLLIDFFEKEHRKNLLTITKRVISSFGCFGLVILQILFDIFSFAKDPEYLTIFLLIAGIGSVAAVLYYCTQRKNYTENEIAAFLGLEPNITFTTAAEMLQSAKKYQKADLKQYEKAFQAIEQKLANGEKIKFSMVAETVVIDEECRDGWKPWHIALAVSEERILISGESVRGRFMTSYDVESFELKNYLGIQISEKMIRLKFQSRIIKISGCDLEKAGEQLKAVLEQK